MYGCSKAAQKRDPATGFWYCRICFRDARPDLAKTLRCFVCFSTGDDVTESACGLQQSASCNAARLCGACRSMHAVAQCFSCWGLHGACYNCNGRLLEKRCIYETRLCWRCGVDAGVLRCFFCKRSDNSVTLEDCDSKPCARGPGSVPVCATCLGVRGWGKIVCRSCFARDWKGRCYRCHKAWARRSQSRATPAAQASQAALAAHHEAAHV